MLSNKIRNTLILKTVAVLVGLSASPLAAQQIDNCCNWDPCCFEYGLNPPPTCPTNSCCNFLGEIEYLYWKPYVGNAPAAKLNSNEGIPFGQNDIDTSYSSFSKCESKDFNYNWDSGFRVAIGYGFPCDKWGVSLDWTHYQTSDTKDFRGHNTANTSADPISVTGKMPVPSFLFGNLTNLLVQTEMGELKSTWDFQFNQVDLELFRNFYVGCSLSLKPYVGLRALFLKNHFDTIGSYEIPTEEAQEQTGFVSATVNQRLRSDFKSVGLKAGLESFWELFCGLGIYGDIGASALYACMDTDNKSTAVSQLLQGGTVPYTENVKAEVPQKYQTLKFMTDLALGIQWRNLVNCNQNMIVIKLGWEHHMLFRASEFSSISKDPAINLNTMSGEVAYPGAIDCRPVDGDISLYGFTASISYSF